MSFSTKKFKFNKDFELSEPELHDCEITELKISGAHENRTLDIQLVDELGVNIRMSAKGAVIISCSGFRVQNVVNHVSLYSKLDCTKELEMLEGIETTKEMTKNLNAKILNGDLGLIRVNPSVGCEIFCVCKDLEIV